MNRMDWNALKDVQIIASRISSNLEEILPPSATCPSQPNSSPILPDFILPPHDGILAPLSELSISKGTLRSITDALGSRIEQLQQLYMNSYRHACLESLRDTLALGSDLKPLQRVYQDMAQRHYLPMIRSWVSFVVFAAANHQPHSSVESKRPFNNDYTPVLEAYFELNGYPSMAHRTILAEKSNMTPRQIEVWFQNHRNRAKKEHKYVPRLQSDLPLRKALSFFQSGDTARRTRLPSPPAEDCLSDMTDMKEKVSFKGVLPTLSTSQGQAAKVPSILDDAFGLRPPHAYPAIKNSLYPDPFPTEDGVFTFPKPTWRRKPMTRVIVAQAVDMDEITQMFHQKLKISENPRRRGTTPPKRESPPSQPWFHATTTTTPTAPHPALIRKRNASLPTSPSLDSFIGKSIVFSSNTWRVDTSTAFLHLPPGEAPARKTRPLPRRMPSRLPSSPFGSRTSSFSSDTSSGSFASSSSSSYSSSPELLTPPPLSDRDLPVFHDDAQQQDYLFDFSQTDFDTDYPSASQTFDFSFNDPSLNKIPDLSCFSLHFPDFNNLAQIIS